MNPFIKLFFVIGIFLFGTLILLPFVWLVNKKKLLNIWGAIVIASGTGFGYGVSAFLLTYLDEKFQGWNTLQRISVGGQVFIWFFIGILILIPLSIWTRRLIKHS